MAVNIPQLGSAKVYNYKYDQLNRLKAMDMFNGLNVSTGAFTPVSITDYQERISYDPNGNILTYQRNGHSAKPAMDSMTYSYASGKNQVTHVDDVVAEDNYTKDIDDQNSNNYTYDAIGNLKTDAAEGITNISWTVYGKIASITKSTGTITYSYDASGNRISKTANGKTTVYVRDASGNVMSVYEKETATALKQTETHVYGSSRIGLIKERTKASQTVTLSGGYDDAKVHTFTRGEKIFELSNHLGNVLVTVSDKRLQQTVNNTDVDHYLADVVTATDYSTYGASLPAREYNLDKTVHGFNGQQRDKDIQKDHHTALFWEYDGRIGRRWNVDPRPNVSISPYNCFAGNPIWFSDVLGDSIAPNRTEAMNFFVTGTKEMRKQDRKEHGGRIMGFLKSAYTWDFMKAKIMRFLSFGKLKIIQARNPAEMVAKMKEKLGEKGYVSNLTIDYHSGLMGESSWDPDDAGEKLHNSRDQKYSNQYTQQSNPLDGQDALDAFAELNKGYAGWGTSIFLGNCWAGGNSAKQIPDYTSVISSQIDKAMVFGHQAAASTIGFVFRNTFNGPIYAPYAKASNNKPFRGIYSMSVNGITTVIRSKVTIHNNGRITTSNTTMLNR